MDRLELHVRTAANNVVEAKKELAEARDHQKKSGKCLCYLVILGMIALGVILYFVLRPKEKTPAPKAFLSFEGPMATEDNFPADNSSLSS